MLDILLIQHTETSVNLLEYRQEKTSLERVHSDIFTGFLSAIQNITKELNIGTVILISTEGARGHNCIIVHKYPINVIMLVDQDDPIDVWREQGHTIAKRFIAEFGTEFKSHYVSQFEKFVPILKELCATHNYCE